MKCVLVVLSVLVGGTSFARAQTAAGSGAGSPSGGAAAPGFAGSSFSTGHAISGTAGSSGPNAGNAISKASNSDPDASSVSPAPTSRDNAVDTPAAENAAKSLGNTNTGILKK